MKRPNSTHAERVRLRQQINGKPYDDNPYRLPYSNKGTLLVAAISPEKPKAAHANNPTSETGE